MSQYFSNNINSSNTAINVWNDCMIPDNRSQTLNLAINVRNKYTIADDPSQILTWLSPLDPKLRHQAIRERRVGSVGEWLLQSDEFRSWCAGRDGGESDSGVLFCYGNPGVGKTFIR